MPAYRSLSGPLDVPALGRTVEAGEVVECDLPLFDGQVDVWEPVAPAPTPAKKKATPTPDED